MNRRAETAWEIPFLVPSINDGFGDKNQENSKSSRRAENNQNGPEPERRREQQVEQMLSAV